MIHLHSYFKKSQVSKKTIYLLFLTEALGFIAFFGGRLFTGNNTSFQAIGIAYDLASIIYLVIIHRLCLYDVDEMANETMIKRGDIGIISFQFQKDDEIENSNNNTNNSISSEIKYIINKIKNE